MPSDPCSRCLVCNINATLISNVWLGPVQQLQSLFMELRITRCNHFSRQ